MSVYSLNTLGIYDEIKYSPNAEYVFKAPICIPPVSGVTVTCSVEWNKAFMSKLKKQRFALHMKRQAYLRKRGARK